MFQAAISKADLSKFSVRFRRYQRGLFQQNLKPLSRIQSIFSYIGVSETARQLEFVSFCDPTPNSRSTLFSGGWVHRSARRCRFKKARTDQS